MKVLDRFNKNLARFQGQLEKLGIPFGRAAHPQPMMTENGTVVHKNAAGHYIVSTPTATYIVLSKDGKIIFCESRGDGFNDISIGTASDAPEMLTELISTLTH